MTKTTAVLISILTFVTMAWVGAARATQASYDDAVAKTAIEYNRAMKECKTKPQAEEVEAATARAAANKAKKLYEASKEDRKLREDYDAAEYKANNLGRANCIKRVNGYFNATKKGLAEKHLSKAVK